MTATKQVYHWGPLPPEELYQNLTGLRRLRTTALDVNPSISEPLYSSSGFCLFREVCSNTQPNQELITYDLHLLPGTVSVDLPSSLSVPRNWFEGKLIHTCLGQDWEQSSVMFG